MVVSGVSIKLDEIGVSDVVGNVVTLVSGSAVMLVEGVVPSVAAGAVDCGSAYAVRDVKTRRITAQSAASLLPNAVGMTIDPFMVWFSYRKPILV